jgi:xanthine dehydrogenase/oxidase
MKNGANGSCCKDAGDRATNPAKQFKAPEFIQYDPATDLIFPPALQRHEFKALAFGNKRKRWYRPVTLRQLLEIKAVYPSAKIIGGSTETQIEVKFKAMNYSPSVFVGDIHELRGYSFEENHVEIGGNVILTDLEDIMREAIKHYGSKRAQPFAAILKQLRYFAGRQIRNVGTPAGNLATASPISDLNPVFMASNSIIVAKSSKKPRRSQCPTSSKDIELRLFPPMQLLLPFAFLRPKRKGNFSMLTSKQREKTTISQLSMLRSGLFSTIKM